MEMIHLNGDMKIEVQAYLEDLIHSFNFPFTSVPLNVLKIRSSLGSLIRGTLS